MHNSQGRRDTSSSVGSGAPPNKRSKSDGGGGGGGGYFNLDQFLKRDDDKLPPNHIIRISITNVQYPINVEVVYKICSMAGSVRKIVCFERNHIAQAIVEFDTLESADKARSSLHGCDVYDNCCTMKVEYSKMPSLMVKENGQLSWDFTDKANEPSDRRPVILNRPGTGTDMGGMGGRGGAPMGNMFGSYGAGNMGMGNLNIGSRDNMNPTNPMLAGSGMNGASNMMNMVPNLLAATSNMSCPPMGGGGGRGGMGMQSSGGHQDMMSRSVDRDYGDDRTCVLMVYGLDSEKWDPQLLFNLICQYGNVNKIFFMKNKEGTAMVEMGDPEAADNVYKFVGEISIFGNKVRFNYSKKHKRLSVMPLEYELPNGTPSIRNFMREKHLNRFLREDMARKNRLLMPTKVLHFYNVLRVSDEELKACFQEQEAPEPINIKWVEPKEGSRATGSSGLLYYDSVEDASDALVLMNHLKLGERNIKLGYSPAKY
jgi:heterogeneous nuclear ribonucleoprotein L